MADLLKKCTALYKQHREKVLYLVFGGLTTLVDYLISFLLYSLEWNVHSADAVAWAGAVLFAYVTNRIFVFESRRSGIFSIFWELVSFAAGRVLTLGLQEGFVFLFYDRADWNRYLVKVLASVIVVITNYFLSKFLVFRKRKESK